MPHHPRPARLGRDHLDQGLRALIPNDQDRAFILRCVLDEGPSHHRIANHTLLNLLLDLLTTLDATPTPPTHGEPVPMRLPPHLGDTAALHYPLALDLEALAHLGEEHQRASVVEGLLDGPPQHAVANVLMVNLLAAARRKVSP